ncbi:MAG TPA: RnfABCDGE type electron transport complex subunit C [Candidatus Wallbacteria bacterium]|nr:RnfABCDGE type electron transport complex subunit C [Candidatus Wallbacteria bacterium]
MDFHGGIKLPLNNELTEEKPLVSLKIPSKVCVLLSQHNGSPAVACVKPGDRVKTFDLIARGMGAISCDVHAPLSGTVESVSEFTHPHYKYSPAVVIASDGQDTPNGEIKVSDRTAFSLDEIIEKSRQCSIVDRASSNYPLWYKLSEIKNKQIYYLIVNFVQNEPYVHNVETMARNFTDEILSGILFMSSALSPKFIFLAVPYHMKKLIATLESAISAYKNIKIIRVTDKYPQGNEAILASCILKADIRHGKLSDAGCFVLDASVAYFLYEALKFNKPQIDTYLTVSGYAIAKPSNVKVRIGTMISEIIEQCGGLCGTVNSMVIDGLMSGFSQYTTNVPVIKTTSALTLLPTERLSTPHEETCMRCKKCIDHCPASLNPAFINRLSRLGKHSETAAAGIYSCIECGVCSYICPSRINITHSIILSKKMILQSNIKGREN